MSENHNNARPSDGCYLLHCFHSVAWNEIPWSIRQRLIHDMLYLGIDIILNSNRAATEAHKSQRPQKKEDNSYGCLNWGCRALALKGSEYRPLVGLLCAIYALVFDCFTRNWNKCRNTIVIVILTLCRRRVVKTHYDIPLCGTLWRAACSGVRASLRVVTRARHSACSRRTLI